MTFVVGADGAIIGCVAASPVTGPDDTYGCFGSDKIPALQAHQRRDGDARWPDAAIEQLQP